MTINYNGEELPIDLRGRALPSRWDNKNRKWNVLTVEETAYESNYTYCDTVELDTNAKPLSNLYKETREILIQADPDNDHDIVVGNNVSQVIILKPGRQMTIPVNNLNKLYVRSSGSGNNKLNYFARANLLLNQIEVELDKYSIGNRFGLRITLENTIEGWGDKNPVSLTKHEFMEEFDVPQDEIDDFPHYYFIPDGNDFIHVSVKDMTACALRADGTVECWSTVDDNNEVSNKPTDNDFIKIEAGDNFYVGIKEDKSLVSWGNDENGIVSDIPSGNDFIDIKTTFNSAFALREDGTIVGWGKDTGGVTRLPYYNGIISFSVSELGYGHCVRNDGHIYTWFDGYSGSRTLDYTPRVANWKKVYAKLYGGPSFAIDNQNKLIIWGWDDGSEDLSFKYIDTDLRFKDVIVNINGVVLGVTLKDKLLPIIGGDENSTYPDEEIVDIPDEIYIEPNELYN
ncbi:MAG: hypothetical protein ACOCRK_04170 [bacterium]